MNDDRKIDLKEEHTKLLLSLLDQFLPDTEVWAYGSRVKGTAKPYSDLDLVAFVNKDQELALFDLKEALENSSLPFRIDIFAWNDIPEQFKKNIEKEHVVLKETEEVKKAIYGGTELPLRD